MKLKLISLTALTAFALGGAALAQDQPNDAPQGRGGHGGGGMRHDPMEKLTDSLNLTPEQKTKIQPILDEAKPKMEQIHRDAMEKSKAVMDDAEAKIRPLLTADQQKKLDEQKNNRRGGGRKGRHGGGSGGGEPDEG
ncbi:MAG: periplasmic heavy metal sensor [Chthoniobacterales bacterium]|nr:periplasmic heavy metal sensor [Chthoniobacterales bacterium]